jgi:hypothetical protein
VEEWLNSILERIANDTLLPSGYFGRLDCNAALNARDGARGFEAEWLRQFEEVESLWVATGIGEVLRKLAEDIRRESFLAVSRATGGHEIASYVSDDFDLIVRARLVGVEGELLSQLWNGYERGEFPTPPL